MKSRKYNNLKKELGRLNVLTHQALSSSCVLTKQVSRNAKTVFFPGCSLSQDGPELISKMYHYLKNHVDEDLELMLNCCGKPTLSLDRDFAFQRNIDKLQAGLNNCTEIITACPNCYITFKKHLKGIEVTSIWDKIAHYGCPEPDIYKGLSIDPIAIHDPCPLRNESIIHESVRNICLELGLKYVDGEYTKSDTICCGAKDMLSVLDPGLSRTIRERRLSTIESKIIVTYCMECRDRLVSQDRNIVYLGDLIFVDNPWDYDSITNSSLPPSRLGKWINRYRVKLSQKQVRKYEKK